MLNGSKIPKVYSPSRGKHRAYTMEEVNKMLRSHVEPKFAFFKQEIEQRQITIAHLNQKLNQNANRLTEQSKIIQQLYKRIKETGQVQPSGGKEAVNEKIRQAWDLVTKKMSEMEAKLLRVFDVRHLEQTLESQVTAIKKFVIQEVDSYKKKTNTYWLKIKELMGKINSKAAQQEESMLALEQFIGKEKEQRMTNASLIASVGNGRRVIKNLLQLKGSVDNLYENYQYILNVQQSITNQGKQSPPNNAKQLSYPLLQDSRDLDIQFQDIQTFRKPSADKISDSVDRHILSALQPNSTVTKFNHQSFEIFSLLHDQTPVGASRYNHSGSFMNMSVENRREVAKGVKERLCELIEAKNLQTPLEVYVDSQIQYLKNAEGNYLFDLKGNMFKVDEEGIANMENEGIIVTLNSFKMQKTPTTKHRV